MSKVGRMDYDGLISDVVPSVVVGGGTIKKLAEKAVLKRGTVVAKSSADNKLVILGTSAGDAQEKFDGDGTETAFTLTSKPATVKSVKVSDVAVGFSYDASTGVVTCATAPAVGTDNVVVTYQGEALKPFGILCEDVEVGTTEDVTTGCYLAGCFNPDKLIVAEEYSISEADKDALRDAGIFLKAAQN